MAFDTSSIYNVIFIILGIIGLIWLIYSIWYNSKIDNIRTWPKTKATVVNAYVEPESQRNTYINVDDLATHTDINTRYIPHVLYTYNVAGRTYQSTNFRFGRGNSFDAVATQALMNNIRPGSTIDVHYNPTNPTEAYIHNGKHDYTGIWMGLLLMVVAALLAYYYNVANKSHNGSPAKNYYDYDVKTPSLSEATPTATVKAARSRRNFF